jgi:hypothetical protein
MTVARLVYYAVADQSVWRIRAVLLTRVFVWIDVICFLIQAAGGSMMSNTDVPADAPEIRNGQHIYMAGCGAQLGFILIFCGLMVRVYTKIMKTPRLTANIRRPRLLMWTFFAVLFLVVVSRTAFRWTSQQMANLCFRCESSSALSNSAPALPKTTRS